MMVRSKENTRMKCVCNKPSSGIAIIDTSDKPCQCQHTEYWTDYAQWINNSPAEVSTK